MPSLIFLHWKKHDSHVCRMGQHFSGLGVLQISGDPCDNTKSYPGSQVEGEIVSNRLYNIATAAGSQMIL